MKKIKIFTLFLVILLLASCSKGTELTPGLTPVSGVISLRSENLLENEPALKAADPAGDAALTFIFEAWTCDEHPRCVLHETGTGTLAGSAAIEVVLVPGTYDFLFWADYGTGAYDSSNLRQVGMEAASTSAAASGRDAFACAKTGVKWSGGNAMSVTLVRPVAKLAIRNTSPFTAGGKQVAVTYRNVPLQYDVLTGAASAPAERSFTFPATTAGSSMVGEDFLFVPAGGTPVALSVTVGGVTKELDALPLQPNCVTNVTATFE